MSAAEKLAVRRDLHPKPESRRERIAYIAELMVEVRYVRGVTSKEIAEDWGLALNTVEQYAMESSHHLKLLGQREHVLEKIRLHAERWLLEGNRDRVLAARLLLESVGGTEQRVIHHHIIQRSDEELFLLTLSEIRADPALRARALEFLSSDALPILTSGEDS